MCAADAWGLVVNGIAAFGAVGAAIIALVIAGRESRSRERERRAAAEAQARLVRVEVVQVHGRVDFYVRIRNYGDRAIIGADVMGALWPGHDEYRWRHSDIEYFHRHPEVDHDRRHERQREKIVRPARESDAAASHHEGVLGGGTVRIQFLDGAGNLVPKQVRESDGQPIYQKVDPLPDVFVTFMDAEGTMWQTGPSIQLKRIDWPPTWLDKFGPVTRRYAEFLRDADQSQIT